jgi:hypothetical protein
MGNERGVGSRAAQLAVLAAKAAKIAAVAAAGGPYGAGAEAVKQFLPQLVKIVAIILVALLLLPSLAFMAVPHFMFSWADNDSFNVKRMTDLAIDIAGVYDSKLGSIIQDAVDMLTSSLVPVPNPYVTVHTQLGNTNSTWLIAIIAAHYEQDLEVINESTILRIVQMMLVTSRATQGNLSIITITDLVPNALMTLLGFTDDQRKWANLLVSTMNEDQTINESDMDFVSNYDTNYGNITYTEGATSVTHFMQTDSRWGNIPYGGSGTIGTSGCGPTALAIVVSSLTNKRVTPEETAEWAFQNGYRVEGNGSMHALIPRGAEHYGLTVEGATWRDGQKIVDALADGKLVVAIMSKGHFTSRGHFIVLRGVTEDGKILVADPASVKRSEQLWDLSIILNEANRNAGAGGPFWIIG